MRASHADAGGLDLGQASISFDDVCRHGLISGVTGSGKTNTARVLTQRLSAQGVPVLATDAKGDFAGLAQVDAVARQTTAAAAHPEAPVLLWDLQGREGHRLQLQSAPTANAATFPDDVVCRAPNGAGCISILAARELIRSAPTYAAFVLELALRLAERLPPRPRSERKLRLALILEEAHLIFRRLPAAALRKLLHDLRARGVAIVFVGPDPADPPATVACDFGFCIQHALWTCSKAAAQALQRRFGDLGGFDTLQAEVRSLGIGEALVRTRSGPTCLIQAPLSGDARGRSALGNGARSIPRHRSVGRRLRQEASPNVGRGGRDHPDPPAEISAATRSPSRLRNVGEPFGHTAVVGAGPRTVLALAEGAVFAFRCRLARLCGRRRRLARTRCGRGRGRRSRRLG
jgi:hypothetical protein